MSDPVRIAVVGNSFASRVQLPALRWAGGNRVVGLAGHDADKARATASEWDVPLATGDWRELLELDADLFLLTTPVDLHHEMAAAILETGAALLCEKPFTLNVAEAEDLVRRAEGRVAWLDHELRWSPHLRRMRELVHEGWLGEPWHASIEMYLHSDRHRERPWSWWFQAERGGGILGALGSHLVDMLRWQMGEVEAVRAELRTFLHERPDASGTLRPVTADELAHLHLRFANGALGEVVTSIAIPRERSFFLQLTGRDGALRNDGGDTLFGAHGEAIGRLEPLEAEPLLSCADYGLPEYGIFGRCLPLFLRDVIATLRAGERELPGAATFADGLATQRVLDAARASAAANGGWVDCGP